MLVDRSKVIGVIRDFTESLGGRSNGVAPIELRGRPDEMREALKSACAKAGVSVDDYAAALRADPTLAELENEAMKGAMVGSTDPGPYDTISRESPSGQPGNITKSRSDNPLDDLHKASSS